jgi:DNA primase
MQYIKEKNECIVPESEKSPMQGVNNGVPNMTSIGGHILSKYQVEKLTRLGVGEIILCYDEDAFRYRDENGVRIKVSKEEMLKAYKQEVDKFIPQQKVSVMIDLDGTILSPKQSPTDDFEKFWKLYENRIQLR